MPRLGILFAGAWLLAGCGGHRGSPGTDAGPAVDAAAPVDAAPADDLALRPDLAGSAPCSVDNDCRRVSPTAMCCGGECADPLDPSSCGGCGMVCATGLCGTALFATLAEAPDGWSINGDAYWDPSTASLFLTDSYDWEAGSFIYRHPMVVDTFDVDFEFLMGGDGADGLGFLITTSGDRAVGDAGGGLGLAGLDGFGVEVDEWNNGVCGDSNYNHVGVDALGECDPKNKMPISLAATSDLWALHGIEVSDGTWHRCSVHVEASAATVELDGHLLLRDIALPGLHAGDLYWFGFAGATGGAGDEHRLRNVAIRFPTPRCL
jgi:hypothetical protein